MARDPYDILGVPRDAGDQEIRRAYRRLAKQEHPDADGGEENYFCRLNDAYEAIRTPERRRAESREQCRPGPRSWTGPRGRGWADAGGERTAWRPPGGGGFSPGTERGAGPAPRNGGFSFDPGPGAMFGADLFDLFDRIFGGDTRPRGTQAQVEVRLTPEEARAGISIKVELRDGRHHIDVPPGVRDGDVLSFTESSPAGGRVSVDLEVVVR